MRIQFIAKGESEISGMSRYAQGMREALCADDHEVLYVRTSLARPLRRLHSALKHVGLDIEAFFCAYPVRSELQDAEVYYLASQSLATLLCFQRFPAPTLVTVLDIIPFLVRHNPELNRFRHPFDHLFYRLSLLGLRRADALVTISHYSKRTLLETLGFPEEFIHVVYPGIDHEIFRPRGAPESIRAKYGLPQGAQYVLYVGSEDPRRNVRGLIEALALAREQRSDIRLVKVGAAHFPEERRELLRLIDARELRRHIIFLDQVSDEDLSLLYNLADVFVLPSLYEGFGLPALESMACGAPVIASDTGAPAEVVAGAGLLCDVRDPRALCAAILAVLDDQDLRARLRRAGIERAAQFTWQRTSREMVAAYAAACEHRRRR